MPKGKGYGKKPQKTKVKKTQGKKPELTGRELALTRGKGKKKGLKRQMGK